MKSLLVILLTPAILTGCADNDDVELRRFPYPYRAALAVCSDIDETETIDEFLAIQKFLNLIADTDLGPGLGLEVGNSFWFYDQYLQLKNDSAETETGIEAMFSGSPESGLSLFVGTSDTLSAYAPLLLELIRAGYIDCLHSYGHFAAGGFNRALAARAAAILDSASLAVDVFVNHGGPENHNNIGDAPYFLGDNPESDSYHTDITILGGVKFIWRGHLTHCIGQDGDFSLLNLAKQTFEYVLGLHDSNQKFPHDNKLAHVYQLDDGQKVFEFVRYINPWGKYSSAEPQYMKHQLGRDVVDQLIDNQGYMIFYTHFGKNEGPPYFDSQIVDVWQYIKKQYGTGHLLVTTTSRLLNYYVHSNYLFWRSQVNPDSVFIMIDSISNEVEGKFIPQAADLAGLTFYVPEGKEISLSVAGRPIGFVINRRDESGRRSISVPRPKLEFPAGL